MTTRQTPFRFIAAGALSVLLTAAPAFAITAGDVLDRMTDKEQSGYFQGAMEMALYLAATQEKNNAKAECIANWYFGNDATASATIFREILAVFRANKDKPATAMLQVVINRHCGPR